MKRLGLALVLLASLSIAAIAQIGGPYFPGPGLPVGGVPLSPVAFTFQNSSLGTSSGNVQTMGPFALGAASGSTRRVVVLFGTEQIGGGVVSSVVFTPDVGSPVSADSFALMVQDGGVLGRGLLYASAVLPTGANATVAVTWTQTFGFGPRYAVYTVDNSTLVSPTTPTIGTNSTNSAVTSISASANSLAGGGILSSAVTVNPPGTWSSTPSGAITAQDANFGEYAWAHANNVAASTPFTATQTFTSTPEVDIAVLAYR